MVARRRQAAAPWHFLYFLPLPQGQGSLRPTFWATAAAGAPRATAWPAAGGRAGALGGGGGGGGGHGLRGQRDVEDAPDDVLADVVRELLPHVVGFPLELHQRVAAAVAGKADALAH